MQYQYQPQLLAPDNSALSASATAAGALSKASLGLSDTDKALLLQHHHSPAFLSVLPNYNAASLASVTGAPGLMHPQLLSSHHTSTPHHPIAEFLYQLTKMLTDNNREVIEWAAGRIQVHNPHRLAEEVLHKYFRHSKYASFQRQLNYFGFRKIAGKGKMSPCAYVNDAATEDLRSLLFIKRKTNGSSNKNVNKNSDSNSNTNNKEGDASSSSNKKKAETKVKQEDDVSTATVSSSNSSGSNKRPLNDVATDSNIEKHRRLMEQQQLQQKQAGPIHSATESPAPAPAMVQLTHQQPQVQQQVTTQYQYKSLSECLHFPSENTLAALTGISQQQQLHHQQQQHQFQQPTNFISMTPAPAAVVQSLNIHPLTTIAPAPPPATTTMTQPSNAVSGSMDPVTTTPSSSLPCPATAAMNAAAAVSSQNTNFYDSAPYLVSLEQYQTATNNNTNNNNSMPPPSIPNQTNTISSTTNNPYPLNHGNSSNQLLASSLPSSNTLFPDKWSSASLNNLVRQQSGNLSWLNLNTVLSRESSLVELAMVPPTPIVGGCDSTPLPQDINSSKSTTGPTFFQSTGGSIIG